jgi:hypothetical protein
VAKAQYNSPERALEWVEATLTRLYLGKVGWGLGGLRRMQPASEEASKAIDNCGVYLHDHRHRTPYGKLRRGGYPIGSGGIESSNKFICHARLKRSGAWWYEGNSNEMLALRCAKYNRTFDQVFERYRQRLREGRVEHWRGSLGRRLSSPLSAWFPGGATIAHPCPVSSAPSSNRTCSRVGRQ